jgi:hypothetical protein
MIQATDFIADYLDCKSPDKTSFVTSQLDQLTPKHRDNEIGAELETTSLFLSEFWSIFMVIDRQVRYGSEKQRRLLDLIHALVPVWDEELGSLDTAICDV